MRIRMVYQFSPTERHMMYISSAWIQISIHIVRSQNIDSQPRRDWLICEKDKDVAVNDYFTSDAKTVQQPHKYVVVNEAISQACVNIPGHACTSDFVTVTMP